MTQLFLVMAGGALGSGVRWFVQVAMEKLSITQGWYLVVVNIIGSMLLGLLMRNQPSDPLRLFAGAGVLGGFTTFSAFSFATVSQIGERPMLTVVQTTLQILCGVAAAQLAWKGW